MFGPKIKIEKELFERLKTVAKLSGYSSVDEFVMHVLEKGRLQRHETQRSAAATVFRAVVRSCW